jgi:hypothetical protein
LIAEADLASDFARDAFLAAVAMPWSPGACLFADDRACEHTRILTLG